jgi:hypothetical protein
VIKSARQRRYRAEGGLDGLGVVPA